MWLVPKSFRTTETDVDGNYVITGLPREASLIGRMAYEPGYETKHFILATTLTPQQGRECLGYQGTLNHVFKAPRLVRVQVIHADAKTPASNANVRVRAKRILRSGNEGKTNDEGKLEFRLTPGEYVLIAEPHWKELYVKTEHPITVLDEPTEQPVLLPLATGAAVVITATENESHAPIAGVDFLVGTDTNPERSALQRQTVFIDNPKTDKHGELRATLAPGSYQFVVDSVPPGYEAVRKSSDPCSVVAGEVKEVHFEFRRIKVEASASVGESPYPLALVEKWRQQNGLLSRGRAIVSIHRRSNSWLEKDKLESVLKEADSKKVPDLAAALQSEYPGHDFPFGEVELACDGIKLRETHSYFELGERRESGVIAINGKEAVWRQAINAQADVYRLADFRIGTMNLRDLCFWPRIPTQRVNKEGEDDPAVTVERLNGRIKFSLQSSAAQQRQITSSMIADDQTGFIYYRSHERGTDGSQTWQFAPATCANGAIVPGLHVEFAYSGNRVGKVTVYRIQRIELDGDLSPDVFVVAAPAGTNVIDHRGGATSNPKSSVAYEPIIDLVIFANSIPSKNRALAEVIKPGDVAPIINPANWFSQNGNITAPELNGKVVLVEFWGIGCGPCVAQLPEVQAAAERYADRGLVLLGLHESGETVEAVAGIAQASVDLSVGD